MINIKRVLTKERQYRVKSLVTDKTENCVLFINDGSIRINVFNDNGEELSIELDTELLDKLKRLEEV